MQESTWSAPSASRSRIVHSLVAGSTSVPPSARHHAVGILRRDARPQPAPPSWPARLSFVGVCAGERRYSWPGTASNWPTAKMRRPSSHWIGAGNPVRWRKPASKSTCVSLIFARLSRGKSHSEIFPKKGLQPHILWLSSPARPTNGAPQRGPAPSRNVVWSVFCWHGPDLGTGVGWNSC